MLAAVAVVALSAPGIASAQMPGGYPAPSYPSYPPSYPSYQPSYPSSPSYPSAAPSYPSSAPAAGPVGSNYVGWYYAPAHIVHETSNTAVFNTYYSPLRSYSRSFADSAGTTRYRTGILRRQDGTAYATYTATVWNGMVTRPGESRPIMHFDAAVTRPTGSGFDVTYLYK
jgi:hypothetical protein